MSLISALFDSGAGSFEQAFNARDVTSRPMREAIAEWFDLYFGASSGGGCDPMQRMAYVVVSKLTRAVFSEYSASLRGQSSFAGRCLDGLEAVQQRAVQLALIGGECWLKPVPVQGGFDFLPVRRDCAVVLARDAMGSPTSVGLAEQTVQDGRYYTLLERRTADGENLTIENRLFCSDSPGAIGTEVSLTALPGYGALSPVMTLPGAGLGLVRVKTPMVNCVDGSPDGVSVYAPAAGLIRAIDRNEQQINDEFENGASRIIASADMLTRDAQGRRRLSDKLFVGLDDDPETVGVTIFSPALREQSYLARKQEYLRGIESQIGLKRGLLSEADDVEKTATEITSSAGDYNLTVIDFQRMWEDAARRALELCHRLGALYGMNPGRFDSESLRIDWGDGVLFNRDKVWSEYMQLVQAGMLKPELAVAWYFSLPCKTKADLERIRRDYMPEPERLPGDA